MLAKYKIIWKLKFMNNKINLIKDQKKINKRKLIFKT